MIRNRISNESPAKHGPVRTGLFSFLLVVIAAMTINGQPPDCADSPARHLAQIREPEMMRVLTDEFARKGSELAASGKTNDAIRCLTESARLSMLASDFDAAEMILAEASRIARGSGDSDTVGDVLSALFTSAHQAGQPEKLKTRRARIVEILPSLAKSKAGALLALGLYEYDYGTMGRAREFFNQAELIATETADPRIICEVLIYNGYAALRQDDPFELLKKAEAALSVAQAFEYPKGRANANFAIAYARVVVGDNQFALDSLKTAFEDFHPESDWVEKAVNLNLRASIYTDLGRPDVARPMFEQAIGYYERSNNLRGRMHSLLAIGDIEFEGGNAGKAVEIYSEVIRIAAKLEDESQFALVNERLGDLSYSKGDYEDAVKRYKLAKKGYDEEEISLARVENSMALAFEKLDDPATAKSLIENAVVTNERTRNPTELARNHYDLARLAVIRGDVRTAENHILKSLEITERLHSGIDSSSLRTSFFSRVVDRYHLYRSLLMSGKASDDPLRDRTKALAVVEQSRARTFRDILALAGSDFRRDAAPESVRREKELLTVLNLKKSRLTELTADSDIKTLEDDIVRLEAELDDVRLEMKKSSPIYAAIRNPEPFDVGSFQREVLREDEMLLEFSLADDASYLWTVDKREVTAYDLPPRIEIETRVEKLRNLLVDRQPREGESAADYQLRMANAETEYASEARMLSRDLLGQIPPDKFESRKLIVVADGRLHYFPLGALPKPGSPDDQPILTTNEVVYTPSAAAMRILRMETSSKIAPKNDLLVFADPVFSSSDERVAALNVPKSSVTAAILSPFRSIESLDSMPRLPASELEAKAISDVFGTSNSTLRTGFSANRDGVLSGGVEDFKVLHFATHGLIDERRPEMSGILLSLYDDRGNRTDGGFIRLQDVYGLRLNSDLVVLSACETGIGREIRGEGVTSLNNAFLQAGAKSVVSSLWKVDDAATKTLMTEFYTGVATNGLSTTAALRQAQIKMSQDSRYRSPFFWAAFTASGENAAAVKISSRRSGYAAIAIGVIAALLVTYAALRISKHKSRISKSTF